MTITQPHIMKAASLAIHLSSRHGPWGFQPSFPAILVSYTLLMPLSGSRTSGSTSSLIPGSEVGYMCPCVLFLGSVPCLPHVDSHHSYRPALPHAMIDYQSHSLAFLHPISSSSAELYFLILIIISPVSILACVLELLNFNPTHSSWPPTLRTSITPLDSFLSRPTCLLQLSASCSGFSCHSS